MAVKCIVNEKGGIIFSRAQEALRFMDWILNNQAIVIRVKYNNLIKCESFFPHLVKDLAAKEKVDFTIVILALETISSFDLLSPCI